MRRGEERGKTGTEKCKRGRRKGVRRNAIRGSAQKRGKRRGGKRGGADNKGGRSAERGIGQETRAADKGTLKKSVAENNQIILAYRHPSGNIK